MNHNEAIKRYFTAWAERDWEALTELLAEGFTFVRGKIASVEVYFGRT